MYALLMRIISLLIGWKVKVKVHGKENLPEKGSALIVFNHTDFLDTLAIMLGLKRDIYGVVASNYIKNPLVVLFWLIGHAILIKRGKRDKKAQKRIIELLEKNKFVVIAPEGTRSKTGIMKNGKYGTAYFTVKTNSIVVPVGVIGAYGAFEELIGNLFNRKVIQMEIVIGKPFFVPSLDLENEITAETQKELEVITNTHIMPRIAELLPNEMRGPFT